MYLFVKLYISKISNFLDENEKSEIWILLTWVGRKLRTGCIRQQLYKNICVCWSSQDTYGNVRWDPMISLIFDSTITNWLNGNDLLPMRPSQVEVGIVIHVSETQILAALKSQQCAIINLSSFSILLTKSGKTLSHFDMIT